MPQSQPLGKMIIELGLNSANFSKGMKGINQQIKTSMTEMKAHLNVMGQSGGEIDRLNIKQVSLTKVVDAQNKKIALAKENYEACRAAVEGNEQATQKQKDALVRAQNEYVKAIGDLGAYESQLKDVSIRLTAMGTDLYQAGAAMDAFGKKLSGFGALAENAGKTLMMGVTTPILALGTYAAKTTAEFDAVMSKVSAVSGAVGEDFDKLRDKAREMGEKTKFSATEAAEAMNYMAMAGWKTNDMLDGIEGIMSLAAASGESLATTSDIVTDALTGFGKSAGDSGRLADIMAAASSNANTNVSMMGETFKYCTPIAGALGFSMEDTAEAIGLMANSGIKASMAGTSMRQMMNNLAGEVEFSAEAFGEMTIRTQESDGSMRNLNGILADCREAFSVMTEAEKVANAESLVGKNAMSGFLALMNAAPADIRKLNKAIAESEGAASSMAEIMQDNLSGQLTILKSQTDELAISYGDILTPKLKDIVSGAQGVVDKLNKMDDGTKNLIVNVGLFSATVGPAVLVVGKLTSGVGNLVSGIGNGMQSFTLWAAKITHTTAEMTVHTAATDANTAANARNTASLLAKTAKTVVDTAAMKAHTAVEKARTLALAAESGLLNQQAAALNASIAGKIKDTAATAAHTIAEKARLTAVSASTAGLSAHMIVTAGLTTATNACAVATGLLSSAIQILLGPIGLLIAAGAALAAGIVLAVKWLTKETEASKELRSETEKLAESNEALKDSLKNSENMFEDNISSIKAEAGAAATLADKVKELSKVENKSAQQKRELQSYVKMLNESMQGLNIQYDAQTDALNMTTNEIYAQISALEAEAEAQAAQERITENLKEQQLVREQLLKVQEKIAEVTENDALKNRERKEILKELTEQESQLTEQLNILTESYAYTNDVFVDASERAAVTAAESEQSILAAYGSIKNAYEDLGESQKQAIDRITSAFEAMTGKLSDLTEKIKLDSETTWSQIQANQSDTIEKTREFSELYAQLIEAGVSESYLNAIGATGPESIPLLKDMLSQGAEAILDSQAEWQEAYEVIGDTLVDSLSLDDGLRSALKDYVLGESGIYGTLSAAIAGADLDALGESLTEGVSKGILASMDSLTGTAKQMAGSTTAAAEDAWEINSPSRVFADMGKNLMLGLVQGISDNESTVYAKASSVASNVTRIMKSTLDIHSPSGVMRDEVGKNIALGIAEGIEQNADYAKKSAEEVASAVLQAARTKLDNTKVYQDLSMADEAAFWDSVRKQIKDGTQARIDADKQYFQAKKTLDQKLISLETDYASKVKKVHENLSSSIKSLQDKYTDELTSRIKSITGSMGLFDDFTASTELSTQDLLNNLQNQVTGLRDWSNNLKDLERRGVTGDMLDELRNMGTSAAGEIALMTEMTDDELDEYIDLWKEKEKIARREAVRELEPLREETEEQIREMRLAAERELEEYKQEFVLAVSEIGVGIQMPMEQIQTSLQTTMAAAVELASGTVSQESSDPENIHKFEGLSESLISATAGLPEEFKEIGKNTIAGMIAGLTEKSGELYQTMTEIIRQAIQSAKEEAQIHSPSRAMMSIGSYMMKGLGIGIENMQDYVETIAGKSAASLMDVFHTSLGGINSIPIETEVLSGASTILTDKSGAVKLIQDALESLQARQQDIGKKSGETENGFLEQLLATNSKVIELLRIIAEKNPVIDRAAMADAVDLEFENGGMLKARGSI